VPELPRLNDLVWLADARGNDRDRILQGDARDWRVEEKPHELNRLALLLPLFLEPSCPADGKVSAWWVSDHEIPSAVQDFANVALVMLAWAIGRQKIV
jgi:hypothetical protein